MVSGDSAVSASTPSAFLADTKGSGVALLSRSGGRCLEGYPESEQRGQQDEDGEMKGDVAPASSQDRAAAYDVIVGTPPAHDL